MGKIGAKKREYLAHFSPPVPKNDLGRPVSEGKKQPEFANFHSA